MKESTNSLRIISTLLPLVTLVAATQAVALAQPSATHSGKASFAKDCKAEQALSELHRVGQIAIVAEIPVVERVIVDPLADSPLDQALEIASRDLHLYYRLRPGSLALPKRYVDYREPLDLEVGELREIVAQLETQVRNAAPYPLDEKITMNHARFVRSLSKNQMDAMRLSGGLPIAGLTPEQQALWTTINKSQAYASLFNDLTYAGLAFGAWPRTDLVYLPTPTNDLMLWYRWPNPGDPEGSTRISLRNRVIAPSPIRRTDLNGERLAGHRALPVSFSAPVSLSGGKTTLRQLIRAIEAATGNKIRIADHLRDRPLLAYVNGMKAADVVVAVEDLYGWALRFQRGREFALGRPRVDLAKDPAELHLRMRALLPQQVHRYWSAEGNNQMVSRRGYLLARALADVDREKGREWRRLPLGEMSEATQRQLANILFHRLLVGEVSAFVTRESPPRWLTAPQDGYFTLAGEILPGTNPLLEFRVPREDGKIDAWGWFVGSSSLEGS